MRYLYVYSTFRTHTVRFAFEAHMLVFRGVCSAGLTIEGGKWSHPQGWNNAFWGDKMRSVPMVLIITYRAVAGVQCTLHRVHANSF